MTQENLYKIRCTFLYFNTATKNNTNLEAICLIDTSCNAKAKVFQSIMVRYPIKDMVKKNKGFSVCVSYHTYLGGQFLNILYLRINTTCTLKVFRSSYLVLTMSIKVIECP